MLIAIAGLLAVVTFVLLFRLLWLNVRPLRSSTIITVIAALLIISLAVLAASGRLSWIAALGAAILPFLRRGLGLLRYLPWLQQLFARHQRGRSNGGQQNGRGRPDPAKGAMTRERAIEILGLGNHPSKEEVIAAHRRLIQKLHPDRGGSTYLAQQLNEARKVLLQEH
jgi:DnaJ homolog subfamily C member 19